MKAGRSLKSLALEINRQMHTKKDYLADTRAISVLTNSQATGLDELDRPIIEQQPQLRLEGIGEFGIKPSAITHLSTFLDIPLQYLRRCLSEQPELFCDNVNRWMQDKPGSRFVRTLDGDARAVLSDRYQTLDHYDLLEVILPVLNELGVEIHSCEVTDTELYIQAVNERKTAEVSRGDAVQAGVIITNSEVGSGSLRISPLIYRLVCTNGLVVKDRALNKKHVGSSMLAGDGEKVWECLGEDARRKTAEAVWAQVRDVTRSALSDALFHQVVDQMRESQGQSFRPQEAIQVVEQTGRLFSIPKPEHGGIIDHLMRDGEFSRYGLINAVTRSAQDQESYDRAVELEELGGKILAMNHREWSGLVS